MGLGCEWFEQKNQAVRDRFSGTKKFLNSFVKFSILLGLFLNLEKSMGSLWPFSCFCWKGFAMEWSAQPSET